MISGLDLVSPTQMAPIVYGRCVKYAAATCEMLEDVG